MLIYFVSRTNYNYDMFTINDKKIRRYQRDLKLFKERAYPFATKSTVNSAAFEARKQAHKQMDQNFTLRNRFSKQSVQVDQTKTLKVRRQAAVVGSTADYMGVQEFGGTKHKKGKQGVALPTGYSAGQESQQPRTRLPRKPNKLQNIQLNRRSSKGKTRAQKNLIAVKAAAQTGQKYIYMDLNRRKGLFKVLGGKRRPYVKMVYDLSKPTHRIPKEPWLKPAVDITRLKIPSIYLKSLEFQLRRHNILK